MAVGIMGHFAAYIVDFNHYQMNIANIEIQEVDLENVEDGVYIGTCDVGYIYAKVEVEIIEGITTPIRYSFAFLHKKDTVERIPNILRKSL